MARFFFALVLASGCAPTLSLGAPCDFNSDCPDPLVCRHERCRTACREARDCPPGTRCVNDLDGPACTLIVEESCVTDGDCPASLRCAAGECRTECVTDENCLRTGACREGSCVELASDQDAGVPPPDAMCAPRPLVCGDGMRQACDEGLGAVIAVFTGSTTGELTRIPVFALPPQASPSDGMPLPPEVALGLSPRGFGVVGQIVGPSRTLSTFRFDARDPSMAAEVMASAGPLSGATSLTLAEDGDRVVGLVLHPGSPSGHRLEFELGASAATPIFPGDPPATLGGHLAIVGGARSVGAVGHPLYFVTREIDMGTSILGAVDRWIDPGTFRAVDTAMLGTQRYLATAGTAGRIVVAREGTNVGFWTVDATLPRGMGRPTADLAVYDLGATGDVGVALENGDGLSYVLAVPENDQIELYRVGCPMTSRCEMPISIGTLPAARPSLVRLARLANGYALFAREDSGSMPAITMRVLGQGLLEVAGFGARPILTAAELRAPDEVFATFEVASVIDGPLHTVVVAAIGRSAAQDRIYLAGFRGCGSL